MVSYSGHGGQLPDQDGDETELQDETWCLYDGELVDDELLRLWVKFKAGVRILVFSDSCHSGTVIRARYQALAASGGLHAVMERPPVERDSLLAPLPGHAAEPGSPDVPPEPQVLRPDPQATGTEPAAVKASVMLISGCQDNQLSADGDFNGLFTGRLKLVWNDGAFQGDYPAFRKQIGSKMPPTQSPKLDFAGVSDPVFVGQRRSPYERDMSAIPVALAGCLLAAPALAAQGREPDPRSCTPTAFAEQSAIPVLAAYVDAAEGLAIGRGGTGAPFVASLQASVMWSPVASARRWAVGPVAGFSYANPQVHGLLGGRVRYRALPLRIHDQLDLDWVSTCSPTCSGRRLPPP